MVVTLPQGIKSVGRISRELDGGVRGNKADAARRDAHGPRSLLCRIAKK